MPLEKMQRSGLGELVENNSALGVTRGPRFPGVKRSETIFAGT